jgi:hypothetical protein
VLLAIGDYCHNDDGTGAFPSLASISDKVRMSVRNTQRLLHSLEKKGRLVINYEAGPGGSNTYTVPMVGGDKLSPVPQMSPGDDTIVTRGVTSRVKTGDTAVTRNRNKPSYNRKENRIARKLPSPENPPMVDAKITALIKHFSDEFLECKANVPYNPSKYDYKALSELCARLNGQLTEKAWQRAVLNYFATPQKDHTIRDLVRYYATFHLNALDKFGKPLGA